MDLQCCTWGLRGIEDAEEVWDDPLAPRREQRGASLVEALAFLGTATVVAVNSMSLLGSAASNAGALMVSQEAVTIQASVRTLSVKRHGATSDIDLSVLRAADMLPESLRLAPDGQVTNQWGGAVSILPAGSGGQFVLAYENVPTAVCIDALTSAGNNWTAVGVDGGSAGLVAPYDMTPELAQQQCAEGPQTVEWASD